MPGPLWHIVVPTGSGAELASVAATSARCANIMVWNIVEVLRVCGGGLDGLKRRYADFLP
jgi:hypothetical protein